MSNGIFAAMEVQGRVIKALYLRELKTRFGKKRLGFLWAFGEPVIHVMTFIAIWKVFGRMGPPGIETVLFLITGIIPYIMFSNIVNKVMKSVAGNKALLVFPQVKVIDFVFSRIVVELTTYGTVFIAFIFFCDYLGISSPIEYPLGVCTKFLLMALLGGGLGYLLMPLVALFPVMEHVVKFSIRVIYISSGVFFSIERLPLEARKYIDWNPVFQIIHMLRADYFPELFLKAEYSNLQYIFFVIAISWLLGIILTKKFMIHLLAEK